MARVEVPMPQMGESIAEGTVSQWLKQIGDTVERDEPILEISTDKVDAEIPAPSAGTVVEVLVLEGETVEVGTILALIDSEGTGLVAPKLEETVAVDDPNRHEQVSDQRDVEDAPSLEVTRSSAWDRSSRWIRNRSCRKSYKTGYSDIYRIF